ncbi:MAG: aminotransferase class III-fold pyridoxal phosphate-dependent enzyme, partial [Chromatiales bacterium]|nr:aminotransferase class III-fold pyridoxal phosphate-dependent enzyme [Chromatiales bacterium]
SRQAATLNTHTRYLDETIIEYVERLTGTFADGLDSAILTCTGSEANDIALRMAETITGNTGVIATDHTYHGNTAAVAHLSTTQPPIGGHGPHVRHVPAPDSYRPLGGEAGAAHAACFTKAVSDAVESLVESGHGIGALVICPLFANEGFPDLMPGFLDGAIAAVRTAGGIVVADEVQSGFGRTGSHMWAHERANFKPDVVTLGKPMGNGHPIGGVVTSREHLATFRSVCRYFNTFGGNAVSCAAAMAMLSVLEEEELLTNALETGEYAKSRLHELANRHECIGDVRGAGLFFGAEMVTSRDHKTPAPEFTASVANAMRHRGVLLNKLGIHGNTLKIRPPMPFGPAEVDFLMVQLDDVLNELTP